MNSRIMDTINPATPMDVPSGARERQQVRTGMPLVVYFLGLTIFSLTIALLKPGVPNKCALLSLRTSSIVDIPAIDG